MESREYPKIPKPFWVVNIVQYTGKTTHINVQLIYRRKIYDIAKRILDPI